MALKPFPTDRTPQSKSHVADHNRLSSWLNTGGIILNGTTAPTVNDGEDGDYYVYTGVTPHVLYGPKVAGIWGTPGALAGAVGATGPQGPPGDASAGGTVTGATTFNAAVVLNGAVSGTGVGTGAGKVAAGDDARFTDARTPTAHAASHAAAGGDPVTLTQAQVTDLTTDLAAKAPLASPTLTGTPLVPTAAVDTNTTQAASTAFVIAQAASAAPAATGTAAVGSSTRFARADHVHAVTFGTTAATACVGNDSRLSDARTPTAHVATHRPGGSDTDLLFARKTADQIYSAAADDTHLVLAMVANATYILTGMLWFSSGAGGATIAFTGPAGVAGHVGASSSSAFDASGTSVGIDGTFGAALYAATADQTLALRGLVRTGATAGNFRVRANGTSAVLKTDSFITLQRVA